MDTIRQQIYWSAMLHDIGKVILRGGQAESRQTHSAAGANKLKPILASWQEYLPVLQSIQYHHARDISTSNSSPDHIAWIICESDNIAAGMDRRNRPVEGEYDPGTGAQFRSSKCLDSIFNIVRTERLNADTNAEYKLVHGRQEEQAFICPESRPEPRIASEAEYAEIWQGLSRDLKGIDWSSTQYLQSLYNILDGYLSYVPSSTDTRQVADISLFDHSVLTAAVAGCIYEWTDEQSITDFKQLCFEEAEALRQQDLFLLVHADVSGIQDFIYTISSKNALKSLRGRSFYLELILEQIADEILSKVRLTRANLLYSGGGGFYMILPNTKQVISLLEKARHNFNSWLFEYFGTDLFLALAWEPATASHFMRTASSPDRQMSQVFRDVSVKLSVQKVHRYDQEQLEQIFIPKRPQTGDRECSVCGKSEKIVEQPSHLYDEEQTEAPTICLTCGGLMELGKQLNASARAGEKSIAFVLKDKKPDSGIRLPLPTFSAETWLHLENTDQIRQSLSDQHTTIRRIYSKHRSSGQDVSTRIWVGDYQHCKNKSNGQIEFQDFVEVRDGKGIERIAVLRADVDNLSQLFAGGFRGASEDKNEIETLGRSAVLSRNLSRFFKNHINHIASDKKRNLAMIYAGGDDIFAVGAWDEIIDFAIDLREAFRLFTADKLSLSAGIGFFRHNYPISRMADITGQLEEQAKVGPKDQIALFGLQSKNGLVSCSHIYEWKRFTSGVLTKKEFLLQMLEQTTTKDNRNSAAAGKSFLYKMLELLNSASNDKISLARLAYLLARREPHAGASEMERNNYLELRNNFYSWATDPTTRQELITAIMLSVYSIREKGEERQ